MDKFKYDGLKDLKKAASTSQDKSKDTKDSKLQGETEQPSSFVTYSSFHSTSKENYKLYNSWTLDNASDIYICNDIERSNFTKTHDALPGDELCSGKTWYPIEAFGTVTVNIQKEKGTREIQLNNVALVLGFITNLVSIHLLSIKGVHWSTRNPQQLTDEYEYIFCILENVGKHLVLERITSYGANDTTKSAFANKKSIVPRHATFTAAQMHRVLGHASPEVISHVGTARSDITIDNSSPAPSTIDCETCSLSKATEIVSRRSEVDEPENGIPFDRTT